jgi:extradiol dioxygenase family protein
VSITWKLKLSLSGDKCHSLLYRAEINGRGVQMEIHTPVRKNGEFGKQKVYFFADGEKREYSGEEELLKALGEVQP